MVSAVARFLERDLGARPVEEVPLAGKVLVGTGERASAVLARTVAGAYVVGAGRRGVGVRYDLLEPGALRYDRGLALDRLMLGDHTLTVPPGRGPKVRKLLATARLERRALCGARLAQGGAGSGAEAHQGDAARALERAMDSVAEKSATVTLSSPLERLLLLGELAAGEEVLAWMPTGGTQSVASPLADRARGSQFLLVTDRRCALCALSDLGDVDVVEGTPPAVSDENASGESVVSWWELGQRSPAERRLEVARRNWRARALRPAYTARAAMLVRALLPHDPLAVLTAFFLRQPLGLDGWMRASDARLGSEALDGALSALDDAAVLAAWWEGWGLDPAAAMLIVERARALGLPPALTLPLHERAALAVPTGTSPGERLERARTHVELAEHRLSAGDPSSASALLKDALADLPPAEVDDFLPTHRPDVTFVRRRGLSLLADAAPEKAPRTLVRLVQRSPLDEDAVARLAARAEGWSREAAAVVAEVLGPGGLSRPTPAVPPGPVRALDPEHILKLEHPNAKDGSTMGALQAYLAVAREPDRAALRAFCPRLMASEQPEAASALADAVLLLGSPSVDAFVSHGEKGVGVRAYEGRPPFLLLGGQHLDEDGPFHLDPVELRFAIAAEVAHVRFKHKRMTPGEVWAGAWEKSRAGLDLVFTVLPAFRGWDMAEKLLRAVSLTRSAVGRVDKAAQQAIKEESLGVRLDDLVEAHRLMQLTADRAGLVLAGSLRGALRGMFLLDPSLRAELTVVERHGLAAALARLDEEGEVYLPDVLVRVGALIGFWVSETYRSLAEAARPSRELGGARPSALPPGQDPAPGTEESDDDIDESRPS